MKWLWFSLRVLAALLFSIFLLLMLIFDLFVAFSDPGFTDALTRWDKLVAWVKEPLRPHAVLATPEIH